jgi:hypothetical protein
LVVPGIFIISVLDGLIGLYNCAQKVGNAMLPISSIAREDRSVLMCADIFVLIEDKWTILLPISILRNSKKVKFMKRFF